MTEVTNSSKGTKQQQYDSEKMYQWGMCWEEGGATGDECAIRPMVSTTVATRHCMRKLAQMAD